MFTKKDRKIANLSQTVKDKDTIIEKMSIENSKLRNEINNLKFESIEVIALLRKVKELSVCNTYNNEKVMLNKIKELVHDNQSIN